jgi:hypothetical protein
MSISFERYHLKDLKEKFENREFAVPSIQRLYVWDKRRVLDLMDSIFRDYPIGICLVWNANYVKTMQIRPNSKTIIPPLKMKNNRAELIIDGQQRLSTIYGVLFGIDPKPEAKSTIDFRNLFFSLGRRSQKRFIINKNFDDDTRNYVRLTTLLNTPPSALSKKFSLTKSQRREATKCYKAFHSYPFYILYVDKFDFNDVKEIFIRINSEGMTVSRADSIFARAADIKLRDLMDDTLRGLENGYDRLNPDALQNTLALAYDAKRVGGTAFQSFLKKIEKKQIKAKDFARQWKRLKYGYEEAVDFLVGTLGVTNFSLLPSQNIYSMLAFFFYLNKSRCRPAQVRELKKWFWHTCCGERYSGAKFNRNIPDDIKFFKRLANNGKAKYHIDEKINPIDFLKTNYKSSKRSSAASAYYILLRSKKPLFLANGREMLLDSASSIKNRKERHHIYPHTLLRSNNIRKWANAIVNICYIATDDNESISNSHPCRYLQEYRRLKHFSRTMRSYLIPHKSDSPIWIKNVKKGYTRFANSRGKMILSQIEQAADVKRWQLFEKFDEVKKIT